MIDRSKIDVTYAQGAKLSCALACYGIATGYFTGAMAYDAFEAYKRVISLQGNFPNAEVGYCLHYEHAQKCRNAFDILLELHTLAQDTYFEAARNACKLERDYVHDGPKSLLYKRLTGAEAIGCLTYDPASPHTICIIDEKDDRHLLQRDPVYPKIDNYVEVDFREYLLVSKK